MQPLTTCRKVRARDHEELDHQERDHELDDGDVLLEEKATRCCSAGLPTSLPPTLIGKSCPHPLKSSGLRMTGPGAAIAKPLPALSGSSEITTLPAKSMPEASSEALPAQMEGDVRRDDAISNPPLQEKPSVAHSPSSPRAPPAVAMPSDARARPRAEQQKKHERPSLVALGREYRLRRGALADAPPVLKQSAPIWSTPARPRRSYDVREERAAVPLQPQTQPLQRCSTPQGPPTRSMMGRSARHAPGCRRSRHQLQLRRRSRTRWRETRPLLAQERRCRSPI